MLQAAFLYCLFLDLLSYFQNLGAAPVVDVCGRQVFQALVVAVIVVVIDEGVELWRNVSPVANHWLAIRTVGGRSNRDGIGARIAVTTPSGVRHSHVNPAVGYGGSSDTPVHFGLGKDQTVTKVEIRWPSGAAQVLENVAVDKVLTVREPAQ